jgi:uncharacterized protein (TIGR00369 family)
MAEHAPRSSPLTPYARALGIEVEGDEAGIPILAIDFGSNVEGRPGFFHGGATAGLLETAGYAALRAVLAKDGRAPTLKPVNITVQYLSGGMQKRTYALGRITRLGRRNANLSVEAWQDDREKPIASAVMNILMVEPGA